MFSRPPRAPRGKRKEQSTRLLFALRSLPIGNAETRPLGRVHATSRLSAGAPSLTIGFPHSQHGRAKFTSLLALCSLLLALSALPFAARTGVTQKISERVFKGPMALVAKRTFATRSARAVSPLAPFATNYTWNGSSSTLWTDQNNWTPTRTTPAVGDV